VVVEKAVVHERSDTVRRGRRSRESIETPESGAGAASEQGADTVRSRRASKESLCGEMEEEFVEEDPEAAPATSNEEPPPPPKARRTIAEDSHKGRNLIDRLTTVTVTDENRTRLLPELTAELCALCKKGDAASVVALLDKDVSAMPQAVASLLGAASLAVDARSAAGETALLCAVDGGNEELVRLLIDRGASVSLAGNGGVTPLHSAAGYGRAEIIKLLLVKGASVTADDEGDTPVAYAHLFHRTEAIAVFDALAKDGDGMIERLKEEMDPDYAKKKRAKDAVEMARQAQIEKLAAEVRRKEQRRVREERDKAQIEAMVNRRRGSAPGDLPRRR